MPTERHCIILPHLGSYMVFVSRMGDQLQGPYPTKAAAWLAARTILRDAGADASAVLDLTCAPDAEIKEYLR